MDLQSQAIDVYRRFWNSDPSSTEDLSVVDNWKQSYWDNQNFNHVVKNFISTSPLRLAEFGFGMAFR